MIESSEWLHHFVLPLVAGGDVRVRGALGPAALQALSTLDDDERIAEARHQLTAELWIDAPRPTLDAEAIALAVAVQDQLFLAHPDARGPFVGAGRRREVARFAAATATLPAPRGMAELVARHSMLHHLFDLGRDDVRVSFWAGRREYRGSEPPNRLLKWPQLRRVREERWRVGLVAEAVGDPHARAIVAALIAASPLTDLLEPTRLEPRWDLQPLARWLRLPEVARAVADRYLLTGLQQIGPAFVTALFELYNRKECAAESRTATAFLCHLQLLSLLAEAALPEATRRIRLETAIQQQEALRDFHGLFAAAQRLGLGRPADLKRDRRLEALVDSQARICLAVCGEARVNELTSVMSRGVGELALAS